MELVRNVIPRSMTGRKLGSIWFWAFEHELARHGTALHEMISLDDLHMIAFGSGVDHGV